MASKKMITRTIKVHTYTTGKFNPSTMTVENMQTASFPYALGAREKRKLETTAGGKILAEDTADVLYGMPLDIFLQYAAPVEAGDVEAESDSDDSDDSDDNDSDK